MMKSGKETVAPPGTQDGDREPLLAQAENLAADALHKYRQGLPDLEYLDQLAELAQARDLRSIAVGNGHVRIERWKE